MVSRPRQPPHLRGMIPNRPGERWMGPWIPATTPNPRPSRCARPGAGRSAGRSPASRTRSWTRRTGATPCRSSAPRSRRACRSSYRCATSACSRRRSPSSVAAPPSWPVTSRPSRPPARPSSSVATRTCRTSASSAPRSGGWCSTSTTSTRPIPGRGNGTSSASPPASTWPAVRTATRRSSGRRSCWPRSGATRRRWPRSPDSGTSPSGTRASTWTRSSNRWPPSTSTRPRPSG